jgi:DNA-binding transcriptional LysR family regulator
MDLIQLEIFCAVFKERSFSRAAETLGLAQPTVSIRIKEFEEQLGTVLFNRLGRDIEPTDAGKFLQEQALPLLAQRRRLSERMTAFLDRVGGPLVIGTSAAAGEHLLPGIMMAFQVQHPDVHLKLRFFGDSNKTLEDLRSGDIDIGLIVATKGREDVMAEPFDKDELVLITPATQPWQALSTLSLSDLKTHPMIVLETGSAIRAALEQALAGTKTRLADLNIVGEFGRTGAIKAAVKDGYGVAFVSRRAVASELATGVLHSVMVPQLGTMTLSFNIVYERRRELSPTARAFLEHLRRSAPHNVSGANQAAE